jgi:hypothetical protein
MMGAAALDIKFAISIRVVVDAGSCGEMSVEREGHACKSGSMVLDHGVLERTVVHFLAKSPPSKYGSTMEMADRSAPDSFNKRSVIRPLIPAPIMHIVFISTSVLLKYPLKGGIFKSIL